MEHFDTMWNGSLAQINETDHRIDLMRNAMLVNQTPYRAGTATRAVFRREIENMRAAGLAEPANTDCASPAVFALKKEGSLRFCIDYHRRNAITIREDAYPILRMDDFVDSLGGATIFSSRDFNREYYQVPIAPADRAKTTFHTNDCSTLPACRSVRKTCPDPSTELQISY